MNLKTAVEPRIDTDGHRYQELDNIDRFTRKVTSVDSHLSVLIRVYPWLTCLGFSFTAEFKMKRPPILVLSLHELKATAKTPRHRASGRRGDQSECEKCGIRGGKVCVAHSFA